MRRYKSVSQRYSDALTRVSWQDFERLLASWYAGQGYRVEHVGTGASGTIFDGGIDLKLYRHADYIVVQCKHWNAAQVTHNAVHELLGVMLTEQATGAIVVTSGEFTRAAQAAASKEPRVQLIDGAELRQMLGPDLAALVPSSCEDADFNGPHIFKHGRASESGYSARTDRQRRARNPLPGMLFAIIACLVVFYVIRHTIADLARARPALPITYLQGTPLAEAAMASGMSPPVIRVPPKVYAQSPMTELELREWKRKNAESMKILEKTTPEMPLR